MSCSNSPRAPCCIYDPRKGNGQASGRTVELVDLHPTLADLCSLQRRRNSTAKSLKRCWKIRRLNGPSRRSRK